MRRRWARIAFGLVGTGFLIAALVGQWGTVRETVDFSFLRAVIALLFVLLSIVSIAQGFAVLLPGTTNRQRLRRIFYLSQPAKYIPGGIAQPIGQVALTTDEGVRAGKAVAVFVVHSVTSAAAGAFLGSAVSLIPEAPGWLRLVAGLGLLAPVVVWRPVLVRVALLLSRLSRRDLSEDLIPTQSHLTLAFVWAVMGILSTAIAFAIIGGSALEDPPWVAITGFAFAFTVGFLAVPFPSGIGVRETVLAIVLPAAGLPSVIAISAIHRLVAMVGELSVVTATSRRKKAEAGSNDGTRQRTSES
jgi:hypothetical protein